MEVKVACVGGGTSGERRGAAADDEGKGVDRLLYTSPRRCDKNIS